MVQDISTGLSVGTYSLEEGETRGQKLEELLTVVCEALGEVGDLTENKADIGFLLSVVGTYLISKRANKLDDDVLHPNQLFDDNLFPMLDKVELTEEDIPLEEEVDGEE